MRVFMRVRPLLFGVELLDVATYSVVVLLIACMTILAAYVPERRAALDGPLTLFRPCGGFVVSTRGWAHLDAEWDWFRRSGNAARPFSNWRPV